MKYFQRYVQIVILLLFLTSCAIPSAKERRQQALQLAEAAGWSEFCLSTTLFDLSGFAPSQQTEPHNLLTIYFEGDGLAWLTRSQVSDDPTPVNPLGLKLALRHPDAAVVYLARPCQYGQSRNCAKQFWSSGRFSPEVVSSYDQALDQLKQRYAVKRFQLIGYSGGGAIAALVAARRTDVARLVTVAGNLDHRAWTDLHHVSPLKESLNPVSFYKPLENIPQYHFVGGQDKILPPSVIASYVKQFDSEMWPAIKIITEADHRCCWVRLWTELYLHIPIELK